MKNLKLIITIIIFLLICTVSISCEKLIEVDMPNNQIDQTKVFEDVQTANAALSGLYASLYDDSPLSGDLTGSIMGTYTDDLDFYPPTNTDGTLDLYTNSLIAGNPKIYAYWTAAYQKVYMANAIIEGVDNSMSLSSADKNRIKGEALLVRSILFFYLQQIFGDIPLPISTHYQVNQSLGKTSSVDVLNKLVTDLIDCRNMLTDDYRNSERIYPNRKVADLMLAKTYLLQHRWNDAEASLKSIVQHPLYPFQNDITKVFINSGKHIIWQLKPKNNGDATKEAKLYYFVNSAPNTFALTPSLMSTFSNVDKRKLNWISSVTVGSNTWYRPSKYKNQTSNLTEYSVIFRLEETYLLLAESLANQNKIDEALPYVNATRQRAGLTNLAGQFTQSEIIDEILLESRREFFTEHGHRFFDLKRTGRLNVLIGIKPNWKNYHNLWPLPQKELTLNPNMNPQNTGY